MKTLPFSKWSLILLAAIGLIGLTAGCTRSGSDSRLHAGERPFTHDYLKVSELTLAHWDKKNARQWFIRAERSQGEWILRQDGDTLGNTGRIESVLDSLSSLKAEGISERPEQVDLQSQGLLPPWFAIRWITAEPREEYELRVGAPMSLGEKRVGRFAMIRRPKKPEVIAIVSGSAFKVLEHIETAHSLRHNEWARQHVDDVDEAEFRLSGKSVLYVQRHGDGWADRNDKPIAFDATSALRKLLGAVVLEYIEDNDALAGQKKTFVSHGQKGVYEVEIKDRHGLAVTLSAREDKGRLIGLNTDRPKAAFVLAPGSLDTFPKRSKNPGPEN